MIFTRNLCKKYAYYEKREGFWGSAASLFHREKKYRDALTDVTFSIERGEFVGLMGPNGAGKTTLIKLLCGIVRPSSGEASVFDETPYAASDAHKKRFALVMGQKSQLWWDLPAMDSLLLNQSIYQVSEPKFRDSLAYYGELFDVKKYLGVPVRQLSLGERMKLELIAALIHDPELLFLDEPTIGLDAVAQRRIREMLRTAGAERGITLVLTSHYTEDLLELTPRAVVLREGTILYDGKLDALLRGYSRQHTITARFAQDPLCVARFGANLVSLAERTLVLRVDNADVQGAVKELLSIGEVEDLRIEDDDVTLLVERIYQHA